MINKVFQAISHPERREILERVKQDGELNAGELAEFFTFSKPTLSHHLKALTDAELLTRERRGQYIYFQINQSVFEEVLSAMCSLFAVGSSGTQARLATSSGPGDEKEDA